MNLEKKSIVQMAMGAIEERVDLEMSKIIDNIVDPNTKATGKRKLTVDFTFVPDDNRQTIGVTFQCKPKLEPINPAVTSLYVTGEPNTGEVTAVEMVPNIPGQLSMEGGEQEAPPVLRIIKCS